jgi:hypothetical protein
MATCACCGQMGLKPTMSMIQLADEATLVRVCSPCRAKCSWRGCQESVAPGVGLQPVVEKEFPVCENWPTCTADEVLCIDCQRVEKAVGA